MAALPVEVVLGVYLGLLTGIIPALVAWSLGFLFKYFTGVSVPALAGPRGSPVGGLPARP